MFVTGGDYKGFKTGYKIIFSFPSSQILIIVIFLTALSQSILGYVLGKNVQNIFVLYAIIVLASILLYAMSRQILNFKRFLGLILSLLLLTSPFLFSTNNPIILSPAGLLLLGIIAYLFSSPNASLPFFLASAFIPLATGNYIAVSVDVIIVLVILLLLNRVDQRIIRVAGVSGIDFLRTFFLYILADIKNPLEDYLKKISVVRTIPIHIFDFISTRDGRVIGRIVVSDIHPGPLREVGSSTLPQLVMNSKTPTLYLKGPSTHSENLASSENLDKILALIETHDQTLFHGSCLFIKTNRTETMAITSLIFGENVPALVFLDPLVPLEDMPYRLQLELESKGIILVDNHSTISKKYDIILPESSEYFNTLKEVLNTLIDLPRFSHKNNPILKASFKKINYSDGREVSQGGINVAFLDNGEKSVSIVAIDGNNMNIRFKSALFHELKSLVDTPLITTTDTHVYSGRFTGIEYIPVGSSNSDSLREIIIKGVNEASQKLEPVNVTYRVVAVKDYFISGEMLDKISKETEKNIRDGFTIFALIILEMFLFSLLPF